LATRLYANAPLHQKRGITLAATSLQIFTALGYIFFILNFFDNNGAAVFL